MAGCGPGPPHQAEHGAPLGGAGGQLGDAPALGRGRLAHVRARHRGERAARARARRSFSPPARSRRCPPGRAMDRFGRVPGARDGLRVGAFGGVSGRAGERPRTPVPSSSASCFVGRGERDVAARARGRRRHVPAGAAGARHRARSLRGGLRRDPRAGRLQPAPLGPGSGRRLARPPLARRVSASWSSASRSSSSCGPTRSGSRRRSPSGRRAAEPRPPAPLQEILRRRGRHPLDPRRAGELRRHGRRDDAHRRASSSTTTTTRARRSSRSSAPTCSACTRSCSSSGTSSTGSAGRPRSWAGSSLMALSSISLLWIASVPAAALALFGLGLGWSLSFVAATAAARRPLAPVGAREAARLQRPALRDDGRGPRAPRRLCADR